MLSLVMSLSSLHAQCRVLLAETKRFSSVCSEIPIELKESGLRAAPFFLSVYHWFGFVVLKA